MIPKSILNDIKDRISIAGYIGERIPLKKAGRNHKGLCPFHGEKTPSFLVSDDKGIYHCFGCGEGGDLFQFVMKFEGLDFAEAVRQLAARAGVEIPRNIDPELRAAEDATARKKRWCLRVNEIARDYFVARLLDPAAGAKARAYLQRRGITEEFSTQLFLGSADNSWDRLTGHLQEKGVPLDLAAELGLLKRRESGGYYDFFRDRLLFPIMSPRGEVLGFSGRDIGEGGEGAKYVNSPDSLVYHKSNCVYGLNRAATAMRTADHAILVEGNIDLVALHQAGFANTVAPLGTALTTGHLRLLSRYTRNMTVVFDGDVAGARAAARSLELFIDEGLAPRVVVLPEGEDPDSIVRKEGAAAFAKRLEGAIPLFDFVVDQAIAQAGGDATGRIQAAERIAPLLRRVSDPAQRGIYRRNAARRLDVDERVFEQGAATGTKAIARSAAAPAPRSANGLDDAPSAERMIVQTILRRPEIAEQVFAALSADDFEDGWCQTAVGIMGDFWRREGALDIGRLLEEVADGELALQMRRIALAAEGDDEVDAAALAKDCIARLKGRPMRERLARLNEEIRSAEVAGRDEELFRLLQEKRELAAQMHGR